MKAYLVFILLSLLPQILVAQSGFAFVSDKDGFANVRSNPVISDSNVIYKIPNDAVVFVFTTDNYWSEVEFIHDTVHEFGFIHSSRLHFVSNFQKLSISIFNDSTVNYSRGNFRLFIQSKPFDLGSRILEWSTEGSQQPWLATIDGQKVWGTDGEMPRRQYAELYVNFGNRRINLPCSNMFEPNFHIIDVHYIPSKDMYFISSMNGDGAGGYVAFWIIEKQKLTMHNVIYGF